MTDCIVYPGELRGYRWWGYMSRPTVLRSLTLKGDWTETMVGRCVAGPLDRVHCESHWEIPACTTVPCPECRCGLYAFYEPQVALYENELKTSPMWDVFGVIAASGVVIPGTRGFRAERARIVAVVGDEPLRYYPNVKVFPTVGDLVEAYPSKPLEAA